MPTINLAQTATIGGVVIAGRTRIDEEGAISQEMELPTAKAGTLTTRTDANTGIATVATGHEITTAHLVDVYWTDDDGVKKKRIGMTVTATGGTTISIDGGAGDDLPALNAELAVARIYDLPTVFAGDDAAVFGVALDRTGTVHLRGSTTNHLTLDFDEAGQAYFWSPPAVNPIAGDSIDTVRVSNSDSSRTAWISFGMAYSSN